MLAHGYDLGVARHGGFAARARVSPEWLVPLPAGLDTREAMVIGTAGFTAALSVMSLEDHGITPQLGPVLVTGATGGVGSVAVSLLAGQGFEVVASTGKKESHEYLRRLGATEVIDRSTIGDAVGRPLDSMLVGGGGRLRWRGDVGQRPGPDSLRRARWRRAGLPGERKLPTTVLPFILRAVSLLGIDSVQTPMARRRQVWERLAGDLKPAGLDSIGHDIGLEDLDRVLNDILSGAVTGRYVVKLTS